MKVLLLFIFVTTQFLQCFSGYENIFQNYFMPFAAAAYSKNPSDCLANIQNYWLGNDSTYGISIYRRRTFNCQSLNATCSGYTAIDENDEIIIIAFAGTKNYEEFYEQSWNYDEMVSFILGGKVSKQFFDAYIDIWMIAGMKDDFLTLKNKYPSYSFYVVGHSTGGAIASLVAGSIVSMGITKNVALYTFGQPRIGDKIFADSFIEWNISSIRFIHNHDIVPHLPSLNTSIYYHHPMEAWYPNDMQTNSTVLFCNQSDGEDPTCSDSLNFETLNYDDHKYYYGRDFIEYGVNGCPDLSESKKKNFKQTDVKTADKKGIKSYSKKIKQNQ